MSHIQEIKQSLAQGAFDADLDKLYGPKLREDRKARISTAVDRFAGLFGGEREIALFSAPGRTEIGGNHTDHQHGRVLAASVDLDILCVASLNGDGVIRIQSEGYPRDEVELSQLEKVEGEANTAQSLIRGIAAAMKQRGYRVQGFDAYTTSNVLKGSGLSSSAAFEVAVGTMISHLFNGGSISPVEIAQIGQYAENVYFGKPSGLMDQTASSVGGFVAIDFADPSKPVVEPVPFDFAGCGYALCIVDTKGDHADLTGEYAAITQEMKAVAALFGKEVLRDVDEGEFHARLGEARKACGDRAVLRALHFYGDNARVPHQVQALKDGDFGRFRELIIESGQSSFFRLQNVFAVTAAREQGLSLALALSEDLLAGRGAWRVHGGGFAGTIQAFVPLGLLDSYREQMQQVFGEDCCYVLNIRPVGGYRLQAR